MTFFPGSIDKRVPLGGLLIALLGGCSTFSSDGGFGSVAGEARTQLGVDVLWPRSADEKAKARALSDALLAHPLSADDAVEVALLNNHALQAFFQNLGVSEADLVQSGRLPNPRFTLRRSSGGNALDVEETLTFNVISLIAAPYLRAAARQRFAQVQSDAVRQVARLTVATRVACFTAIAARDSLNYAIAVESAAQTGAELAQRMQRAGNWNQLDQARQESFHLEALQQLTRAQERDQSARAELRRVLGVSAGLNDVELAEHLPDLPATLPELPGQGPAALQRRIDLKIMRAEIDELSRRLELTKVTRFLNVLEVGPTRVQTGPRGAPAESGYEVSFEVPIFDSGDARVHKSEALYNQAVERYAQAAIDAQAEIAAAGARYHAAFALAQRDRDHVMPMQTLIAQQDLLRYNASLVSVFDLLADARVRISAAEGYIGRLRDFWIEKSRFDTALIDGPAQYQDKDLKSW